MWEQVKPITMLLEQENDDGSRFVLHLFSHDFELIKVRDAFEYNSKNELIGEYSRVISRHDEHKHNSNYFVEKLTNQSRQRIIEFYENPNIFIEYFI